MTIAACYDLQLECDGENCAAGDYGDKRRATITGELGSKCRRQAKRAGWRLFLRGKLAGFCLCPSCVRRGAKPIDR